MDLRAYVKTLDDDDRELLARRCGTSWGHLRNCGYGQKPLAPAVCAQVERWTLGAVTVEETRPDMVWVRVVDPSWPDPRGRPAVDVSRSVATA